MSKLPRAIIALFLSSLGGCGIDDTLSACLSASEPTILLRQLNAPERTKERFDWCVKEGAFSLEFCRGLYLNGNSVVRECMRQHSYTFTDPDSGYGTCAFQRYAEPSCYGRTLYLKAASMLGIKMK
jgi:hypothetical protein